MAEKFSQSGHKKLWRVLTLVMGQMTEMSKRKNALL